MRPPGPIRQAALQAAREVASTRTLQPWVTRHDIEQRLVQAGVGRRAVKHTWENLLRCGALRRMGRVHVPALGRQVWACAPVEPGAPGVCMQRGFAAPAGPDLMALWWRGGASKGGGV